MNPFKQAVMTICVPAEQVPLEEPPMVEPDLEVEQAALTCPQCGAEDPVVQMVDDASVAKCPQCEHEFELTLESVPARELVVFLNERKRRRRLATLSPKERNRVEDEVFSLLST